MHGFKLVTNLSMDREAPTPNSWNMGSKTMYTMRSERTAKVKSKRVLTYYRI